MTRPLHDEEKDAIRAVEKGADILSYGMAATFRKLDREVPGMVVIGKPRMAPKSGAEKQPYFGVIATTEGLEAANN
jgi:hypothetical protein